MFAASALTKQQIKTLFFKKEDNCFPGNSPSLERWCSILLSRCIHMADCKVLGDFLHILKVEERIEASFIFRRKRKYGIIMLRENSKYAAIIKSFINLSHRLVKSWSNQVRCVIVWEKWQSFISKPFYKATCANLL